MRTIAVIFSIAVIAGCDGGGLKRAGTDASKPPPAIAVPDSQLSSTPAPKGIPEGAALLVLKLSKGQKISYDVSFSGKTAMLVYTVKEKTENGYAIELSYGKTTVMVDYDVWGNPLWKSGSNLDKEALQFLASTGLGFGILGIRYPDAPVKPGSIWQDNVDAGVMVQILKGEKPKREPDSWLNIIFLLENLDKKTATVSAKSTSLGMLRGGGSLENKMDSTITVDVASGLPESSKIDCTSTLRLDGATSTKHYSVSARLRK